MDLGIKVSDPQEAILTSSSAFNLFLAGVGSGKTHLMAILSADFVVNYPHVRGFIGANTYTQLSKSTLSRIFDVWKDTYGMIRDVDYVVDITPPESWIKFGTKLKEYKNVISFNNGCTIFLSSLDNYKVIDGTEFGWALLDETKDTKEEAVKEVITPRLRQGGMWTSPSGTVLRPDEEIEEGSKGYNPLYVFTSPAKVDWLNDWFGLTDDVEEIGKKIFDKDDFYCKEKGSTTVVISSTFHNEHNLPPGYIETRMEMWDENKINMLIYGSPIAKTGGEWWSRFDRQTHVKPCKYDPTRPLHITFDFNVVPYMTMLVCQLDTEKKIHRTIKQYCLENPNNTTESCCLEFLYDFGGHKAGLYYYGDPSGKNRTTLTKGIRHNYDVVEDVLRRKIHNSSNRVLRAAPSLVRCKDFCNRQLAGGFGWTYEFDPSVVNLLADFDYLKEGIDGGYVKKRVKDEQTGATYEKYGHCADAWRYHIVALFEDDYDDFV